MIKAIVEYNDRKWLADLSRPFDLSLPLHNGPNQVQAWYVAPLRIDPVRNDQFIGAVIEGGSVNFRNIEFNPHGHGTHTECVGHISPEIYSINQALTQYHFVAQLITLRPERAKHTIGTIEAGDEVISVKQLEICFSDSIPEAVIIRTLPNVGKQTAVYSNSNPAYLTEEAAEWLKLKGVNHLLIDLPSVDREEDGGELKAHRAFWNYPDSPRHHATITELIFVPDSVPDGLYLLELGIAPFENDAAPSRPVIYPLELIP